MTMSGHLVQVARQALYPNLPVPNKVATMAVKQVRHTLIFHFTQPRIGDFLIRQMTFSVLF
jgi:hypothetical protein